MPEPPCEVRRSLPKEERATFLALPREVRDAIYASSLIATSPIVVWSGKRTYTLLPKDQENNDEPNYDPRDYFIYGLKWDREAMVSSLQDLGLGLLRCNRTMAPEAASTFYGKNTFSFVGDHDWIPIISWLDRIGETNRGYLTNLEASARRLSTAWQYSDGTRARIRNYRDNRKNEIFPRSPHFSRSLEPLPQGEVENIDPAIETIFSILGRSEGAPKLVFTLKLGFDLIPGIVVIDQSQDGEDSYFSMDLPNLIEKWRVDYTTDFRCRPVEVLWKAESFRKESTDKRELIKEQGWEILEEEEAERIRIVQLNPREYGPYPTMRFTLRRKELTGPLVAADPSPWTWRMGPDP
jgi:hypothetical protein